MMKKLHKEFKPFLLIASAAYIIGFMGMLGANQAAKLVGISVAIAYESPAKTEQEGE